MEGKILSVRSKEGKTPLVIITAEICGQIKKYTVSEGTYREIGCPLSDALIDESTMLRISYEDEQRRALAKALRLLSFSDNNEKTLVRKIRLAGFSKNAAEDAAAECVRLGYVNEQRQLEHLILRYHSELLGPRKIYAKLLSRSFSSSQIKHSFAILEAEGKIDFSKNKKILLEEKLGENASFDEKQKLLQKWGYTKW